MSVTVSQRSPRYAYASCGKNDLSYLIARDSVLFSYGFCSSSVSVVRKVFSFTSACCCLARVSGWGGLVCAA